MKKIIYTQVDGQLAVVHPAEGSRRIRSLVKNGKKYTTNASLSADSAFGTWPVHGVTEVEWAETEDEFVQRVAAKTVPAGIPFRIVDADVLPDDRYFRNAWVDDGLGVTVDRSKAEEIHRDKLREMRAVSLQKADVEFMKALESWLDKQPNVSPDLRLVMDKKRALRDVTVHNSIKDAKTMDDLKRAIPPVLSEK